MSIRVSDFCKASPLDISGLTATCKIQGPRWYRRLPLIGRNPARARKTLRLHGQGRLLDFGCGSGSFLLRMKQQGWKVTGLDISEAVVDRLRSQLGLHAFSGSL